MPEQSHKSHSSTRTSTRPQGVRMSKRQRKIAQETFLTSYKLNANKTLASRQRRGTHQGKYGQARLCRWQDDYRARVQ